jgi:hypothetical protein
MICCFVQERLIELPKCAALYEEPHSLCFALLSHALTPMVKAMKLLCHRLACSFGHVPHVYSILEMRLEVAHRTFGACVIKLSWTVHASNPRQEKCLVVRR